MNKMETKKEMIKTTICPSCGVEGFRFGNAKSKCSENDTKRKQDSRVEIAFWIGVGIMALFFCMGLLLTKIFQL